MYITYGKEFGGGGIQKRMQLTNWLDRAGNMAGSLSYDVISDDITQ